MGVICTKGSNLVQFFHKSAQEFCAGKYLQNNLKMLRSYLESVTTVKDAMRVAPVLIFASRSTITAKVIIQKLLRIVKSSGVELQEYYAESLSLDDLLTIQQYIELCLDCNFEADANAEFVSALRDLFLSGEVLFYGISSRIALALAYFMRYCDRGAISSLTLRPVAHISDPSIKFGAFCDMFDNAISKIKYLTNDKIQHIKETFISFNPDLHDNWIHEYPPSELLAYIPCIQASEGLHVSSETNIAPIIHAFRYIKLEYLSINDFQLGNAFHDFLESIENGYMRSLVTVHARRTASTKQHITRIMSLLHKMPFLRDIDIGDNNAEIGQTIPILADSLNQCNALQALSVHDMKASADDMQVLAQRLPPQLTMLDIMGNEMSDAVAECLIDTLPQTLLHLSIGTGMLSKSKHNELLHSIHSKCTHIQTLSVWGSDYPVDLINHVGLALVSCTDLTSLTLGSNCHDLIPEDCVNMFLQRMQQSRNIKLLSLLGIRLDRKSFHDVLRVSRLKRLHEFR